MKNRILSFFVLLLSICASGAQLSTLSLSAGQRHAMALRSDGSVWAWGTSQVGELGLGTNKSAWSPTRVASLTNVISIAAGTFHSLAVQDNGTVWAWGTNNDGRLGNGTSITSSNPVPVSRITNAVIVAAGGSHSLAVLASGQVMAWGANVAGQLGTGNTVSTNQPVMAGNFTNAIAVAAGTNFSLALTADGHVWSWGTNNLGQLGLGNTTSQHSPVQITTLSNIVQISAGQSHCLALDTNGVVYAWGRNTEGELANGTTVNATGPIITPAFGASTNLGAVKWIAAGYNSSSALLKNGRLFYWGWSGNGTTYYTNLTAQELDANSEMSFQTVVYGDSYLLATSADGSTWAWGFNQYAQWGVGNVYATNDAWSYDANNVTFSFSPNPHPVVNRFARGDRNDFNYLPMLPYNTFVLPLDMEQGVRLDNYGSDLYSYGASEPWFLQVQKTQRQHAWQTVGSTTNLTRFTVDNPIVAFGTSSGGSPLYVNQPYRFGIYGGAYSELTGQTNMIRILVYNRNAFASGDTNIAPTNIVYITLPRRDIAADSTAWVNYVTNGNRVVVATNDLITSVEFNSGVDSTVDAYSTWGMGWIYAPPNDVTIDGYRLTHMATSTNYCYIVEALGSCEVGANVFAPMGVTNNSGWTYLPLYAMGFDTFPNWRAHFIDNPNFAGTPLPPTYQGRTQMELNGLTASITNNIWLTNNPAYTNLDTSPELRRSPILDQFVKDMRGDPLALANYVVNNIGLTDPEVFAETANTVVKSVEVGGINRSALGTFLEGQGSPVEQCALLVYLLRSAGYPATYVWPTNSNLQLMDTTVSRLWQINVHGIQWDAGIPVVTNSLITVDYPWVVANIGTNSVQIFPWLKNTEIHQGMNIYNFLPTNYPNAYSWVKDYALANPSLMALASPADGIAKCWQNFLTSVINTNSQQQNLSLEDFGVWSVNRPYTYTSWSKLPVPDVLNDQSKVAVLQTMSDSPVTYPFLTNIFDQIRIEVFKSNTNTANRVIDTGYWRTCDLEDRKLLLYTNANNSVRLWMSGYDLNITNASGTFTNYSVGTNAVCVQIATAGITSAVTNLPVRITNKKRVGLLINPAQWFYGMAYLGDTRPSIPYYPSDVTAVIPGEGSVSPAMLQIFAQDYWSLQQQRATNANFIPAVTSETGDAVMITALSFFQNLWSNNQLNQNLHSVRCMSWDSYGAASLTHLSQQQMQLKLDMFRLPTFLIGNAMATQASGDTGLISLNNYLTMMLASASSAEYTVLASVWGDQNAVSVIRLLQLAAQNWRSNGMAPPLELNVDNYVTLGNQSYGGYGAGTLKSQIPAIWNQVTNIFTTQTDSNFVRILITPGQVTNSTGLFQGMSMLSVGQVNFSDYISDNQRVLHGGDDGSLFADFGFEEINPTYYLTYNLTYSAPDDAYYSSGAYSFSYNNSSSAQPQTDFSQYDVLNWNGPNNYTPQVTFTPQQNTQGSLIAFGLNLPATSTANAIRTEMNKGWFGNPWAGGKQAKTKVFDPVQVVSGDFCADNVDLTLAGPMPLHLRRNYQSRNLANCQFGAGWKMSVMPWLVLTTNSTGTAIIDAAEADGSVLAYRYQSNNVWSVAFADNPDLVNFTSDGIGGTANVFNNYILQNPTNNQIYTLFGSDGSKRVYQMMTNFAIINGTNYLDRIRPYLTLWQDHAGNYYQFIYGTNVTANNFGQLYRIQGANGTSLTFKYDYYGRITQAVTDDSRVVEYQYDNYGDLVGVTLPDNTAWTYGYQHYAFTTNSQTYTDSLHLLTTETKPDGRQLVNAYDSLRRVVSQEATVGINRELITNACFFYTNNCTSLTNGYVSGLTCVQDVFGNPYYYFYTNNLVTEVIQPLGVTNIQTWYSVNQSNQPGYYQGSLEYTIDARRLTNWFRYDSNGNITNRITYGDLTGNGISGDSTTNTYVYTTNNCIATSVDPDSNQLTFVHDPADAYRVLALQLSNSGIGIATNRWIYTNVTSVVDMGGWFQTNSSFGLCAAEVMADVATNTLQYGGRGFPIQLTRYANTADVPGNSDPAVSIALAFTPRGDLASATDTLGRQVDMNYDNMGRLQWRDVFDENSNAISRETFYYNDNGELEWYDGPKSNPDDYILFSYDGAGRKVQETHWLSSAKPDGSGIQAGTGVNQYSTTFYSYDFFGNLTSTADQRGAFTTNRWDALGRLIQRTSYDTDGLTPLATEGFGYEVGGLVQYYTNALGGVTETLFNSTGQPRFRQNADGSTNGWTYYLDGRLRREIQNNGAYFETTYNDTTLTATRIFYSPTSVPLATNSLAFDRRGNIRLWTDAGGNTFTNYFDGLGRIKEAFGPQVITITGSTNAPGGLGNGYATNIVQQIFTYFYDSCGKTLTISNALGETTTITFDAIGRMVGRQIYPSGGGIPVRTETVAYSMDNNNFTTTDGSGANAISTTVYTDTYGLPLLSVVSPSPGSANFLLRNYDTVGNLTSESQASTINNTLTVWQTASLTYDGLNRVKTLTQRDNALTSFSYDPAGDLTNRVMPGATLTWSATYNNAGQILTEMDNNGGTVARSTSYTYYPAGHRFAGLPDTVTDGTGVVRTDTYDDWLRLTNVTTTGTLPEQQMTLGWTFDPRGYVTNLIQSFASGATGPSIEVRRSFDPYGQLSSEAVNLGGNNASSFGQIWDSAGRRIQLVGNSWSDSFTYRADGLMTAGSGATFGYANNGLLTGRTNSFRTFTINQRDGMGRPLNATTIVGFSTALAESWNWLGDGSPATYIAQRSDYTDARSFSYGSFNRRLIQESFNVANGQFVTNSYTFDDGATGGMGILTSAAELSGMTNSWKGGLDGLSRVVKGTNSIAERAAYGSINGPANVTAYLDGLPIAVSLIGSNGGQWRSTMDLTPGPHQLTAYANPPGSLFVTNVTSIFTNDAADTSTSTFDANGQLAQRVWLNASGQTNRIQTFTWDAFNRLTKVTERDNQNNGYNWQTDFDPFGRRVRTTTVNVSNNIVASSQPTTIVHYYDPAVEFLEIGVTMNGGLTTWKNYGPDLNGIYGGEDGLGGLESLTTGFSTVGLIQDGFGNILGSVTNMSVTWNAARVDSYAAVAGYPALSFETAPLTAEHLAWRGKWRDMTGLYYWGARPYDPERRAFLSTDPYGHNSDDSLYSAFAGSPTVNWDPDARLGKNIGPGQHVLYDEQWHQIASYSDYDAFYTGNQQHIPYLATLSMPITDQPSDAFGGNSFRMTFGNGAAGAADFVMMMDLGPLESLADVADSARQAGEASVTGEHPAFAYTRAGVSFVAAAFAFEEPLRQYANDTPLISATARLRQLASPVRGLQLKINPNFGELGGINFNGANVSRQTEWQITRHGDMPIPRPNGFQSHHGVNSVWAEANIPGYRAADAPAVLMQNDPFHNATRGIFNRVRMEIAARQGVSPRNIDWSHVPPGTAWRLAEEQFQAAQTPLDVQEEYFLEFNSYLESLH